MIENDEWPYRDPAIEENRQIALEVLQPSSSELEHGLSLHRDAIVIDAYGFSAFANPDTDVLQALVNQRSEPREWRSSKVAMMMTRMADDPTELNYFAEAWRASGVTCVLRNSGEEGNAIPQLIERLAHNTYVTDRLPDLLQRATEPDHIEQAKRDGKHCFYFTTNGVPLPLNQRNAAEELSYIRIFFQLGVRMMHLTYNRRNPIGDGCAETRDGGLSDFGVQVVREMNRVGVIVDGAHSSQQTCLDMCVASDVPVVVSHATCMALREHCRAKTDEVIKAVAATGGYIGICCLPEFLGGSRDISAFLDHVDHAVKLVGPEHVAIGTDVAARSPAPDGGAHPRPSNLGRNPWETFWPEQKTTSQNKVDPRLARSMAWTNFPLFTVGLVQRGYSDEAIRAMLGGNVLRVARAVYDRRETDMG